MQVLLGMPVAKAMEEIFRNEMVELSDKGVVPTLGIIRVGERADDLSYERGIIKRFSAIDAKVKVIALAPDCTQEAFENAITGFNNDPDIHGILVFRPLPKHLNEDRLKQMLSPAKDVDCITTASYAGLFIGDKNTYPPCTPQAVIELLDHYHIDVTGKKIVLVGRSLVVGKPLALLLLAKNATVTICHTKTKDLAEECKRADIIIACAGSARMIKSNYIGSNQIVVDVGINMDNGTLCGDVDYDTVSELVAAITPVPGGVGTVTTSVLLKHTILNAIKLNR